MDLAEHVRPQDGRLTAHVMGADLDLRVAAVGVHHGERAAVRILNPHRVLLGLERLGLTPEHEKSLKEAIATPQGLVLLTGPAGSGKTTTLYSLIWELNVPERCIVTVEDPVEYTFDDITQIPVREKAKLGFAAILRAVLRHDPDVIVVGEIRDRETAELAAQAALTGHLVLATLHASGIEEAAARLGEMGVPLWLVRTATIAAVSQRLLRRLCLCRRRTGGSDGLPAQAGLSGQAGGCSDCAWTGYRGRIGVFRVVQAADGSKVGHVPHDLDPRVNARIMWEAARDLIRAGVTDEAEARRVLGPEPSGLPAQAYPAGRAGGKEVLAM
jgi:type II secretory ATPase GspE/PulE/Tfp pilus assembly ATPase PilB-like protein